MRVTIGVRTSTSSLRTCGFNLSGPAALLGFAPESSFVMLSSMILKGFIWGTLREASFMACLLSCSWDSGEGFEKTDLNWSFSMVVSFFCRFPVFHYFLVVQPLLCLGFLCFMNCQNLLLLSCMPSSSFGDIMSFMYDQYAWHLCLCTNPL